MFYDVNNGEEEKERGGREKSNRKNRRNNAQLAVNGTSPRYSQDNHSESSHTYPTNVKSISLKLSNENRPVLKSFTKDDARKL